MDLDDDELKATRRLHGVEPSIGKGTDNVITKSKQQQEEKND